MQGKHGEEPISGARLAALFSAAVEARTTSTSLDELASLATPGPWRVRRASLDADHPDDPPATYYIVAGNEKRRRNMGHFHPDDATYYEDEHWVTEPASDRDYYTPEGGMSKENAEFVVALANGYWERRR